MIERKKKRKKGKEKTNLKDIIMPVVFSPKPQQWRTFFFFRVCKRKLCEQERRDGKKVQCTVHQRNVIQNSTIQVVA